jgi:hypothetical protein
MGSLLLPHVSNKQTKTQQQNSKHSKRKPLPCNRQTCFEPLESIQEADALRHVQLQSSDHLLRFREVVERGKRAQRVLQNTLVELTIKKLLSHHDHLLTRTQSKPCAVNVAACSESPAEARKASMCESASEKLALNRMW